MRSESDVCERDRESTLDLADASLGRRVAGRYVLLEELGRGGTSVVYRAFQLGTRRMVALKILDGDEDPEFSARFRREAEITASLESPHTVTVYDFGESEEGELYLAMELIEGASLEDAIEKRGALPPNEVRAILSQIVDSLEEAHRRGLVHRDLKPSNAIVSAAGRVTVLDFGLARALGEEQGRLTQPGSMFGTPPYMAPEMWSEDPRTTGIATDIYALGAMTFEMLTGAAPFAGAASLQAFMHAHLERPAPKLGELRRELAGSSWERAIAKALEKSPEARWPSAAAFFADLDAPPPRKRARVKIAVGLGGVAMAGLAAFMLGGEARPLEIGAPELIGPLPESARQTVGEALFAEIRSCHARAPLVRKSRLHLVVKRDGRAASELRPPAPAFESCLAPAIDRLRLPPLADGRFAAVSLDIDFAHDP